MKSLFLKDAQANKDFPIGAGIWLRIHPEDRVKTPYTNWTFDATTTRLPEFAAPGIGRESNVVTVQADLGEKASGVLYALGGAGGGVTLYMDEWSPHLRIQYDDYRAYRYSLQGRVA